MDTNKKIWIYGLQDPRDNIIKYVGKSKNPDKRYKNHLYHIKHENTKKSRWIKKLLKLNLKPILVILKETDEFLYEYWEEFYIKKFLSEGINLKNYDEKGIGTASGMNQKTRQSISKKIGKHIFQYDLDGNFLKEFSSLREAERILKIDHGNISKCLKGEYRHVHGFIFTFEKKVVSKIENKKSEKKEVVEIDEFNNIIQQYESIADASKKCNIDASNISRVCNGKKKNTYGRFFKFKKDIM